MGGQGSGRKPDMTKRLLNELKTQKQNPTATTPTGNYFLPNHSGDHSAGIVLKTPTDDKDIVNKEYVDSAGYWTRTGTTLKPKTDGDNVDIDGGDLLVSTGTAKIDNLSANKQAMITIADNISFANNLKAQFGTSQDFQIYFDATNARFDLTSGSFRFNSNAGDRVAQFESTDVNADIYLKDATSDIRFRSTAGALIGYVNGGFNRAFQINSDKTFRLPNDNQAFKIGAGDDLSIDYDGTNANFDLTSGDYHFNSATGEFFFNAGGTTAHSPALGTPALVITDNYNGVSGLSFSNISTGTGADTRFMIKDTGGHYFTFGQPSLTNTATLFGLNRNEIDTIFNAGGTSRDIVIGTLGSKSVYLASNGALRFEIDSGGDIHNNADNKKLYQGQGNDAYMQFNGTDWEFKADNVGSGAVKILSDTYFSGSGTGLPFGEIYVEANTTATTISVQNTWYQFTGFDTNGQSNLTTPDHTNDHITISKAGVYKIDFNASFSGGGGKTYEMSIQKNNGATILNNIHVERKLGAAGDIGVVAASGFCSCSANDTIELWIRCTDVSTANATLKDVNLNLMQIGG